MSDAADSSRGVSFQLCDWHCVLCENGKLEAYPTIDCDFCRVPHECPSSEFPALHTRPP
jgi:hypothetical protein